MESRLRLDTTMRIRFHTQRVSPYVHDRPLLPQQTSKLSLGSTRLVDPWQSRKQQQPTNQPTTSSLRRRSLPASTSARRGTSAWGSSTGGSPATTRWPTRGATSSTPTCTARAPTRCAGGTRPRASAAGASTRGGSSARRGSRARPRAGGGASKRADRRVETGGYWRLEQSKERLKQIKERRLKRRKQSEEEEEDEADGVKNCFGFYVGRDDKTPWLMQEFTSANDDGAGKLGVPALYRVYVTPRATRKQLTGVFAKEDDVKKGPDGNKKPARAMIPQGYFDRIASLLPKGSVRAVVQEHVHAPSPSPPVAPVAVDLLDYHGQHGQYLGHYEGQQYLGQNKQQQHGPCCVVAPPATPGLLGEFAAAEAPPDNISMSMVEFMGMFNEQPVGIVNEQPAETVKEGEPDWGYLPDIVDADVFKNFNDDEG